MSVPDLQTVGTEIFLVQSQCNGLEAGIKSSLPKLLGDFRLPALPSRTLPPPAAEALLSLCLFLKFTKPLSGHCTQWFHCLELFLDLHTASSSDQVLVQTSPLQEIFPDHLPKKAKPSLSPGLLYNMLYIICILYHYISYIHLNIKFCILFLLI